MDFLNEFWIIKFINKFFINFDQYFWNTIIYVLAILGIS
jgi:hypothetical protein